MFIRKIIESRMVPYGHHKIKQKKKQTKKLMLITKLNNFNTLSTSLFCSSSTILKRHIWMSQILTLVFPKSFVQRRKTLFVIFNLFLLFEGNTCNFTFIKCFIPASKDQCNVEIYSPRVILPLIQRQLPKGVSIKCWRKSVVLQKKWSPSKVLSCYFWEIFLKSYSMLPELLKL